MKANFANGNARSNTGFRSVLFSATGELRPVAFCVRSGYAPDRGTVQVSPRQGDLIARVEWRRAGAEYTLAVAEDDGDCQGVAVNINDAVEMWATLKRRHAWLDSWLEPVSRGPSFLPDEGWGGESLADRSKRERCEAAIRRYGLPFAYSQEWAITPKSGLNTAARPLDFDPATYQAEWRSWDGSMVGINRKERFFSTAGNGSPAIELLPVLDEEHGSNYAHERTERRQGVPGIPGWDSRRYLIRVVDGAYTREHHSYGVRMDVWDTTIISVAQAA